MTFRAIAGHRRVKRLLTGASSRESIPPTLLFAGPPGVGKALMAGATAAALNCLSPLRDLADEGLAFDACGVCRSCDRIARKVHVEVLWLSPDERASIKIDAVRAALESTAFRPFEGRRRVVIIRDADTLEVQAQNALLKSLEEPPPGTIFILTTAVPDALLPTVRSRCMRLRFGRLTEAEVAAVLERDHGLSAADARDVAAYADGSVGQALALGSTDLLVLREIAVQLLQQAGRTSAVAPRLQSAATIVGAGKQERTREDIGLILRMLASMLRDIELVNAGADPHVLANPALSAELRALAGPYAGERARTAFGAVDRAIVALGRNAGPKLVAEWLATRI